MAECSGKGRRARHRDGDHDFRSRRHAKAFLSVESVTLREGVVVENDIRLFVSSRGPERLTPKQWLYVVRAHWGIENHLVGGTAGQVVATTW